MGHSTQSGVQSQSAGSPFPDLQADEVLAALMDQGLQASQAGQSQAAIAAWQTAAQRAVNPTRPYVLIASEYASLGNFDAAQQWFTLALIADPENLIARYQLGLLQYTSAKVEGAFLTWAPLLQSRADHPLASALAHFVNAFVSLTEGNHQQVHALFRTGMDLLPQGHPLAADAQRIIDQISVSPATDESELQPVAGLSPDEDRPGGTHYLIANYGRSAD